MAEDPDKKPSTMLDKTGEFFNVGAPLHAIRPGYIRRAADDLLFDTLVAGNYAHVIAPDRTGKTSLVASTSARLQNNGFKVATLDLDQISERDGGSDAGRWYYSIAYRLCRQLHLKTDLQTWWQDHSILSNRQRLVDYPNLWAYTRELYQIGGVAETVNMDHIKTHYYGSHKSINPTGIVPKGPDIDFTAAHNRD